MSFAQGLAIAIVLAVACEKPDATQPPARELAPVPEAPSEPRCTRRNQPLVLYSECKAECARGLAAACAEAAGMHWRSDRVRGDGAIGVALAIKACDLGSDRGCQLAASYFEQAHGIPREPARAAEHGKRAAALFVKACDGGDYVACGNLGLWFEEGLHLDRDVSRARALYRRADDLAHEACDGGDGQACFSIARELHNADNDEKALGYDRRGCTAGDAEACEQLAEYLPSTSDEGNAALRKACDLGYGKACFGLATRGWGTPTRVEYAKRGCERDFARACEDLGNAYRHANPPNREQALTAYRRACALHERSCSSLKELERER